MKHEKAKLLHRWSGLGKSTFVGTISVHHPKGPIAGLGPSIDDLLSVRAPRRIVPAIIRQLLVLNKIDVKRPDLNMIIWTPEAVYDPIAFGADARESAVGDRRE